MRKLGVAVAAVMTMAGVGTAAAAPAAVAAPVGPASSGHGPGWSHGRPTVPSRALPEHLAAPYVDVTSVGDLATTSRQSGSKYLTLAFLQTASTGSCDLTWAGDATKPVSSSVYGAQIDQIRRRGGDVIPSLGGYTADTTNTELADSCTDPARIAASLEKLFTTYRVHRVDLDIEADAITNTAGIDRRNEAIALVEAWGRRHHYPVSFSYTLPSTPQGLAPSGLAVLQSAAAHHATIDVVNIMTFDYWDGAQHDMLADAVTAATGLTAQLKATILPNASRRQLWKTVGITQMIGIDDFGPTETYSVPQAEALVAWARSKGLAEMNFWALGRDNGNCPGQKGQSACSGVAQADWAFSRIYAKFTSRS